MQSRPSAGTWSSAAIQDRVQLIGGAVGVEARDSPAVRRGAVEGAHRPVTIYIISIGFMRLHPRRWGPATTPAQRCDSSQPCFAKESSPWPSLDAPVGLASTGQPRESFSDERATAARSRHVIARTGVAGGASRPTLVTRLVSAPPATSPSAGLKRGSATGSMRPAAACCRAWSRPVRHSPKPAQLHRTEIDDPYGDVVFRFQVVTVLSAPGIDYEGGEFVLVDRADVRAALRAYDGRPSAARQSSTPRS
jgi:hypothetical protein